MTEFAVDTEVLQGHLYAHNGRCEGLVVLALIAVNDGASQHHLHRNGDDDGLAVVELVGLPSDAGCLGVHICGEPGFFCRVARLHLG